MHELSRTSHVVTVFGSSRAQPGDEEYRSALRLGALVAERGWVLCNGGHEGTMEAAARGAKDVGGHTIGVSLALYRPTRPNAWLDEEIVAESLFARLERLVTLGEAFVVIRGGIGTLLELALSWNLAQSPEFAHKPVVLVGDEWRAVFELLTERLPMHPWEASSVTLVPTVESAVEHLARHFSEALAPDPER